MKRTRKYAGYGDNNFIRQKGQEFLPSVFENSYQFADRIRNSQQISGNYGTTEGFLNTLAAEIRARSTIIKQEIYLIGELLHYARNIIKSDKNINYNFEEWVKINCDFSYSTALNFSRIFSFCTGSIQTISDIPLTVLYKVCSKKFPEELRKYLFDSKKIKSISSSRLEKLSKLYKEHGAECTEKRLDDFCEAIERDEIRRLGEYKTNEAISMLKAKKTSLGYTQRKKLIKKCDNLNTLSDKIINHIDESFSVCIKRLEKLNDDFKLFYPKVDFESYTVKFSSIPPSLEKNHVNKT